MLRATFIAAGALAAGLFSLAAAGAQETEAAAEPETLPEPPRCVRLVNIHGYSVIDSEHVVLKGGSGNRRYLATLRRSCPELRFGTRLTTSFGANARICHPTMEYIGGRTCRIEQIEEVESLEAARALINARAQAEDSDAQSR